MDTNDKPAVGSNTELGPLPRQRCGQANSLLITKALNVDDYECGHWESPAIIQRRIDAAIAAERERCAKKPLTRQQIDAVMTQHYPLSSLLREEVDAFEACVRDLERLHGIEA